MSKLYGKDWLKRQDFKQIRKKESKQMVTRTKTLTKKVVRMSGTEEEERIDLVEPEPIKPPQKDPQVEPVIVGQDELIAGVKDAVEDAIKAKIDEAAGGQPREPDEAKTPVNKPRSGSPKRVPQTPGSGTGRGTRQRDQMVNWDGLVGRLLKTPKESTPVGDGGAKSDDKPSEHEEESYLQRIEREKEKKIQDWNKPYDAEEFNKNYDKAFKSYLGSRGADAPRARINWADDDPDDPDDEPGDGGDSEEKFEDAEGADDNPDHSYWEDSYQADMKPEARDPDTRGPLPAMFGIPKVTKGKEPMSGLSLEEINDDIRRNLVGNSYTLMRHQPLAASGIWDRVRHKMGAQAITRFREVIPEADYIVTAGISFQLYQGSASYACLQSLLEATCKEFVHYRMIDWEIACIYNNRLPFVYRDGVLIKDAYQEMQDEQKARGKLSSRSKLLRFVRNQFHLNSPTYESLVEYLDDHKISISNLMTLYDRIPFMVIDGPEAKGYPYAKTTAASHVAKYGVQPQEKISDACYAFRNGFEEGLKIDNLHLDSESFTYVSQIADEAEEALRTPGPRSTRAKPNINPNIDYTPFVPTKKPPVTPAPAASSKTTQAAGGSSGQGGGGGQSGGSGGQGGGGGNAPSGGPSRTSGGRLQGLGTVGGGSGGAGGGAAGGGGGGGGRNPQGPPGPPGGNPPDNDPPTTTDDEDDDKKKDIERRKRQYAKKMDVTVGDVSIRDSSRPRYTYRRSRGETKEEFRDRLIDDCINAQADGDNPVNMLMITMASELRELVNERKNKTPEINKDRIRDASENRVIDFDYDNQGRDADEILGRRFANCAFNSDVERQAIAKDIFLRVVLEPNTRPATRAIAFAELGTYNPGAAMQSTLNMASGQSKTGMTSILLDDVTDGVGLIPPPIFGTCTVCHPNITKSLNSTIGNHKIYLHKKENSKPLLHALPAIREAITSANLNADAAFTLFENITGGALYDTIRNNKLKDDGSGKTAQEKFEHVWKHIQTLTSDAITPESADKELRRLVNMKPTKDIGETLTKIVNFIIRMYDNHKNPEVKRTLTQDKTVNTIYHWVQQHFPHYYSTIENTYEDAKRNDENQRRQAEIQGIKYVSDFDEVDTFVKVIINYLQKQSLILQSAHPVVPNTGGDKDHKDKKAHVSAGAVSGTPEKKPKEKKPVKVKAEKVEKEPPVTQAMLAKTVKEAVTQALAAKAQAEPNQNQVIQQAGNAHKVPGSQQGNSSRRTVGAVCVLCNKPNHVAAQCFTYKNERPGHEICGVCGGRHVSECRTKMYKPGNGNANAYNRGGNRGGYQNMGNRNQNNYQQGIPNNALIYQPEQKYYQGNNNNMSQPNSKPSNQNQFGVGQGLGNVGRQAAPQNNGNI